MSVVLYSGLPGSGKSYAVVEHVLIPAARAGRPIVTNVPLVDRFGNSFGCLVLPLPETDSEWAEIPGGAVIVIDEAWRLFPSGLQANKLPEGLREAFSMHRHKVDDLGRAQQIVLVTQKAAGLCRFARDLVEQHFLVTKLSVVGASRRFRVDVYEGIETETRKAQHVRQIFGSYSADVWQWYRSHTAAEETVSGSVDEASIDGRGSVWRSKTIVLGVPFAIAFLIFGGYRIYSKFAGDEAPAPAGASAPAVAAVSVGVAAPPVVGAAGSKGAEAWSARWRIVADLSSADGSRQVVLLEDTAGRHRRVSPKQCIRVDGELVCSVEGERVSFFSGGKGGGAAVFASPVTVAAKEVAK